MVQREWQLFLNWMVQILMGLQRRRFAQLLCKLHLVHQVEGVRSTAKSGLACDAFRSHHRVSSLKPKLLWSKIQWWPASILVDNQWRVIGRRQTWNSTMNCAECPCNQQRDGKHVEPCCEVIKSSSGAWKLNWETTRLTKYQVAVAPPMAKMSWTLRTEMHKEGLW